MKFSNALILIALISVWSYPSSGSASVLGRFKDSGNRHGRNQLEFDPYKSSENGYSGADLKKASKTWPAVIEFSAFGVATLYINGIIYSKVFSPHPWNIKVDLAKGDVIAIKAEKTSNYAGVMLTIAWKGRKYRSGRHVFKVRSDSYFTWNIDEQDTWNRAVSDLPGKSKAKNPFCAWKSAETIDFKTSKFDRKASFIWSLNSYKVNGKEIIGLAQTVYIRHVMGGDKCGKDSRKRNVNQRKRARNGKGTRDRDRTAKDKETSSDVDDGGKQKLNSSMSDEQRHEDIPIRGQSNTRFCKCRLVSLRGGTCFDMVNPGDDEGPCNGRPCEPQYECVHDGKTMCLMRRMLTKVVMIGVRSCKKVPAVTDLLVPYKR